MDRRRALAPAALTPTRAVARGPRTPGLALRSPWRSSDHHRQTPLDVGCRPLLRHARRQQGGPRGRVPAGEHEGLGAPVHRRDGCVPPGKDDSAGPPGLTQDRGRQPCSRPLPGFLSLTHSASLPPGQLTGPPGPSRRADGTRSPERGGLLAPVPAGLLGKGSGRAEPPGDGAPVATRVSREHRRPWAQRRTEKRAAVPSPGSSPGTPRTSECLTQREHATRVSAPRRQPHHLRRHPPSCCCWRNPSFKEPMAEPAQDTYYSATLHLGVAM